MRWHRTGLIPTPGEDWRLKKGEDSLGAREPVTEVVGGVAGRGEQVPQQSNNVREVEELSFKCNGGC